jgi:hypothetical protein
MSPATEDPNRVSRRVTPQAKMSLATQENPGMGPMVVRLQEGQGRCRQQVRYIGMVRVCRDLCADLTFDNRGRQLLCNRAGVDDTLDERRKHL